mgnify:CR=1 FL=1
MSELPQASITILPNMGSGSSKPTSVLITKPVFAKRHGCEYLMLFACQGANGNVAMFKHITLGAGKWKECTDLADRQEWHVKAEFAALIGNDTFGEYRQISANEFMAAQQQYEARNQVCRNILKKAAA